MMQQKWDARNLAALQKEIKTALDPIIARHQYYIVAKAQMIKSINEQFFIEIHKEKIHEVTQYIAGGIKWEPIDQRLLAIPCDTLEQLTQTITGSGLGLRLEGDFFVFPHQGTLKPETVEFMKKLAVALTAYRVCFGTEKIYQTLLTHSYIQTEPYEDYQNGIIALASDYRPDTISGDYSDYLKEHYIRANGIKKTLDEQHKKLNIGKELFIETTENAAAAICGVLEAAGFKLIEAMAAFPDNTWFGNGWYSFVTGLIAQLLNNYYSYSMVVLGTLNLNPEYFSVLRTELTHFSSTIQDKMDQLKLAYLQEADTKLTQLIWDIKGKAIEKNIVLDEEKQTVYGSDNLNLLFQSNLWKKLDSSSSSPSFGPHF
jgi:hypothetical protein